MNFFAEVRVHIDCIDNHIWFEGIEVGTIDDSDMDILGSEHHVTLHDLIVSAVVDRGQVVESSFEFAN